MLSYVSIKRYSLILSPHQKITPSKIGGVVPQKLGGYNNNILIDNINTTTTNAHTHDKLQDEIDEMKRDESWQETICMNHKLQLLDLDNLFRQFKIECLCNDKKEHPTITEAKQHFNNWLYKKENRNGNNRRNNPIDNIERAQQQAIAESMELIRKAKERDSQI